MLFTFLLQLGAQIHSVDVSFVQTLRNMLPTVILELPHPALLQAELPEKSPIYMTK